LENDELKLELKVKEQKIDELENQLDKFRIILNC